MTIREHIRSRLIRGWVSLACFVLLLILTVMAVHETDNEALIFIPFAGAFLSSLYLSFFIRCPKCSARIGDRLGGVSSIKFCPGCGESFDSEV